jgi:uncharacterized protein YfiM (DUF2279 family)
MTSSHLPLKGCSPSTGNLVYKSQIFWICLTAGLIAWIRPCPAGENDEPVGTVAVRKSVDAWFAKDKAQHFVVSFLLTGAASYATRTRWNWSRPESVKWGVGLTLSLGILKEIRDLRHPRTQASLKDLTADILGVASGVLLLSWW